MAIHVQVAKGVLFALKDAARCVSCTLITPADWLAHPL